MRLLLLVVVVSAPVMLLVKPLYIRAEMKKEEESRKLIEMAPLHYKAINDDEDES
jgi:hypothetical protein